MADTRTKEQREADWWAEWWKEDYTWDGLAQKPLQGWVVADGLLREWETGRVYGQPAPEAPAPVVGEPATVQDYWRAVPATGRLRNDAEMADELVAADGQPIFHRIHLPLAFKDGTPTGKADWADDALDVLIAPRLRAAETSWAATFFDRRIFGTDGRAALGGTILLSGFAHSEGNTSPLIVDCRKVAFVRDASFGSVGFAENASFEGASFAGEAIFAFARFAYHASFESANFGGVASFRRASFAEEANFHSASFADIAIFSSARFRGSADFGDAKFLRAGSLGARFQMAPRFAGASVHPAVSFDGMNLTALGWAGLGAQLVWLFLAAMAALGVWLVWQVPFHFADFIGSGVLTIVIAAGWVWTIFLAQLFVGTRDEARLASVLAKISAENRNHLDEARFFRHQLKAQRLMGVDSFDDFYSRPMTWLIAKPAEKALGLSYEIIADYGLSFIRPLFALITVTLASALLFWAWEGGAFEARDRAGQAALWQGQSMTLGDLVTDAGFLEAVSYSASRAFPFGPWGEIEPPDPSNPAEPCSFAARILAVGSCRPNGIDLPTDAALEGHRLLVRLMGLAQSLFAILLAFLFSLAIRRRFQIS